MTLPEAYGLYLRTEGTNTIAAVTAAKVFWGFALQDTPLPYVIFALASSQSISEHMNGAGDPEISTIAVKCCAASQAAAWTVALAVKADTHNLTGLIPSTGTVKVKKCVLVDKADATTAETLSSGAFCVDLTFKITT